VVLLAYLFLLIFLVYYEELVSWTVCVVGEIT